MKEFDFYQIAGVVAPGMVVVVGGMVLFFPNQQEKLLAIANMSLGSLGLGLILAYVVGILLQGLGELISRLWWLLCGGMPTDWVRTGRHDLIANAQRIEVERRVRAMLAEPSFEFARVNAKHWYSITRQIYAAIAAADRAERVDVFNANYGLCRGVAAAMLLLLIASTVAHWRAWKPEVVLVVVTLLSIFRMHRFGVHYGRELIVQFLHVQGDTNGKTS